MLDIHYSNLFNGEINHWWYRVRRELVRNILDRYRQKGGVILDVGCGTGALMNDLYPYGLVYGLDFSDQALDFCRQRGEKNLTLGSIESIPFADNFFDVVVSLDVLEHVQNDELAISEIRRVLKPGGISIIFVPAFKFLWSKTDEISCHKRRYTLPVLKAKLSGQALSILRSSYFNTFLFPPILLVRLLVRLFRIEIKDENGTGSKLINEILYMIFHLESLLLPYLRFPVGVSIMIISKK